MIYKFERMLQIEGESQDDKKEGEGQDNELLG